MEKLKELFILLLLFFTICPVDAKSTGNSQARDWNQVIEAIISVESDGNARAVSGNSVGAMQITPIMVEECNNILKSRKSRKRFTLSDRYSVAKSKEMFLLYQSKYNPSNNVERAIRSWNGGNNYSKRYTQRYYERVKAAMK